VRSLLPRSKSVYAKKGYNRETCGRTNHLRWNQPRVGIVIATEHSRASW
jgi:hypothetical protein